MQQQLLYDTQRAGRKVFKSRGMDSLQGFVECVSIIQSVLFFSRAPLNNRWPRVKNLKLSKSLKSQG